MGRASQAHKVAAGDSSERYADQEFSHAGCLSCAVVREAGLSRAFTGDRCFAILGFGLAPWWYPSYRGMLPCFFNGRLPRLLCRRLSAWISSGRV